MPRSMNGEAAKLRNAFHLATWLIRFFRVLGLQWGLGRRLLGLRYWYFAHLIPR